MRKKENTRHTPPLVLFNRPLRSNYISLGTKNTHPLQNKLSTPMWAEIDNTVCLFEGAVIYTELNSFISLKKKIQMTTLTYLQVHMFHKLTE